MIYPEEEYLQLSGLQHFAFCRRQWALIHIENLWAENFRTVDGALMHEKAHDCGSGESRGDLLIRRGVSIHSASLGISGQCDVLEFRRDSAGIPLPGHEGLWQPYPVEYKRGAPKDHDADALQLCAQAMCLEEANPRRPSSFLAREPTILGWASSFFTDCRVNAGFMKNVTSLKLDIRLFL